VETLTEVLQHALEPEVEKIPLAAAS
jgi:hypothetical protein